MSPSGKPRLQLISIAGVLLLAAAPVARAQEHHHASCPMHAAHTAAANTEPPAATHDHAAMAHDHAGDVDRRGDEVMGFSHTATTHHFLLFQDGGAIDISANDPQDAASLAAIRSHLTTVAAAFAKGDFAMPFAIHGETPPGAPTLAGHASEIDYRYEETPAGARVRLLAKTPETLAAIHDFLRYQITEHRTGDPLAPVS